MKSISPTLVNALFFAFFVAVVFYYSGMPTILPQKIKELSGSFQPSPTPTLIPQPLPVTPMAIKRARNEAVANYRLAQAEADKNNTSAVKVYLNKAIAADPTYSPPYEIYGVLMGLEGKYEEGKKYLQTAIDLNPDSAEAAFGLGMMYGSTGDKKLANEWFQYAYARTGDESLKKQIDAASKELNAK